jgi:hypothetical protein
MKKAGEFFFKKSDSVVPMKFTSNQIKHNVFRSACNAACYFPDCIHHRYLLNSRELYERVNYF